MRSRHQALLRKHLAVHTSGCMSGQPSGSRFPPRTRGTGRDTDWGSQKRLFEDYFHEEGPVAAVVSKNMPSDLEARRGIGQRLEARKRGHGRPTN